MQHKDVVELDIIAVKRKLRKVIIEKYESLYKFAHHEDAKKFGGEKILNTLYDSGTVRLEKLAELYKYFGLGVLTRKTEVKVTNRYFVEKPKRKIKTEKQNKGGQK